MRKEVEHAKAAADLQESYATACRKMGIEVCCTAVSLSVLTAVHPGEPGLATPVLLELRIMEVVVTTGAISRAKLQSNRHRQQSNTQVFTGQMPFLLPNQQC